MKCHVCGKVGTLFRQNPKGEAAIWACDEHDKKQDPEVKEIVGLIEYAQTEKKH